MARRRTSRRWADGDRVSRAAMRHDLEEGLQGKIDRAHRRLVVAINTSAPLRERERLSQRVSELRSQLKRVEMLPT